MFKLFALVFAAILALAVADPAVVSSYVSPAVSYHGVAPVAYSAGYPGYGYSGYSGFGYPAYPYAYGRFY